MLEVVAIKRSRQEKFWAIPEVFKGGVGGYSVCDKEGCTQTHREYCEAQNHSAREEIEEIDDPTSPILTHAFNECVRFAFDCVLTAFLICAVAQ